MENKMVTMPVNRLMIKMGLPIIISMMLQAVYNTVAVVGKVENFEQYDKILIGFPIWYGGAPNVVKTFCNDYDFSGKTVAVFATSGGSGIGKTAEKLQPFIKGTKIIKATLMNQTEQNFLKEWAEN